MRLYLPTLPSFPPGKSGKPSLPAKEARLLVTGVDLIEVERFSQAVERFGERFLARVFTPQERAAVAEDRLRLAARFAAKEAVAKALGTGIGECGWREIEIGQDGRGRPTVHLHGAAQARAADLGLTQLALSLSHTREHAIAFVVAT